MQALLTSNRVAKRLGVSRGTVLNMAKDGRLPAAARAEGPLGAYLFNADQVEWLADHPDARPVPGGDVCGCPDARCVGYHHDADADECPCLTALLTAEGDAR